MSAPFCPPWRLDTDFDAPMVACQAQQDCQEVRRDVVGVVRQDRSTRLRSPVPVGARFGRLVVLGDATPDGRGQSVWLCRCDCGVTKPQRAGGLKAGKSVSCGCAKKERASVMNRSHGMSKSPTYSVWLAMRIRCKDETFHEYARYGGRGIKVCERWDADFKNFLADMGVRPAGLTLDRIDNDGDYEPGNCRWSTRREQGANTSQNVKVTAFGETKTAAEWADDQRCVASRKTLYSRLSSDWSAERALLEPVKLGRRRVVR
jgi:hypothetical protein